MEQLKAVIQKIIPQNTEVHWMIIHEISKVKIEIEGIEFSFVDGKERRDHPFNTSQGYISLTTPNAISEFSKIVNELSEEFKSSPIALANLFIVITRASYNGEEKETLIKDFKNKIGKDYCIDIFNTLLASLNREYYKHSYSKKEPSTTNDWLAILNSSQYMHNISDPLINCLQLMMIERNCEIDFDLLEKMNPLLRAVLIGQYNFELIISKSKLEQLYGRVEELTFLSAYLIDAVAPDRIPPDWLTETLVKRFLANWDIIGKEIFVHIYGLSFRNKKQNKLYKRLENLISIILTEKIQSENDEILKWISKLEFSNDFIALFGWLSLKELDCNKIPNPNRETITNQFISELQRIVELIPVYLASENSEDPFASFQLYEGKYQTTLAYILLFLLFATDKNRKDIRNVCHQFKPLFYGGYRAVYLATRFTEIMILIGLSGNSIHGFDEEESSSLEQYLKIIADTILIPYIHLAERDDEIWDPKSENKAAQYNAGKYLVTTYMRNIRNSEIREHYNDFFKIINEVAIAEWK